MTRTARSFPQSYAIRNPRFFLASRETLDLSRGFREVGLERLLKGGLRIAVKPNLTWPNPRPGVTTTPEVTALLVTFLTSIGHTVSIVESDGGYGSFDADAAFSGHGLRKLAAKTGSQLVNLTRHPTVSISVAGLKLNMPRLLIEETDCILNLPVPKVHVMTRYTGAVKNQWGLIPSGMRLRLHSRLPWILLDLLRRLPPQAVLMDGTYFLNVSGPIQGDPVRRDQIIFANHPLVADAVAVRLMGWDLRRIPHLQTVASALGFNPEDVPGLPPREGKRFILRRNFWNWVALAGFRSRILTYIGYESALAKPLHDLKLSTERWFFGGVKGGHNEKDL